MKKLIIGLFSICSVIVNAQTNIIDKAALYLGVPPESTLDVASGASYVPSFHSGQKIGYWAAATYSSETNSLIAYEVGVFDLKLKSNQDTLLYPNGMVLVRKSFDVGSIKITPLAELGAAIDGKFSEAYMITGVGFGITWHHITLLSGAERWSGRSQSFTVAKVGVAYTFSF